MMTSVMCRDSMIFDLDLAHTHSGFSTPNLYGQGLGLALGKSLFPACKPKIEASY